MNLLELLPIIDLFGPRIRNLSRPEFDAIVDECMDEDMLAIVTQAVSKATPAGLDHSENSALTAEFFARAAPLIVALVEAASGNPRNAVASMDASIRAMTAMRIVERQFPAATVMESLQAATTHVIKRATLTSNLPHNSDARH